MSRQLPDLRRYLTDLRLRLDDRAEVLLRRSRRHLRQQEQHLSLAGSRLFLLSPRPTLEMSRQRLAQTQQLVLACWQRGQQERRRHLDYCRSHLNQLNPLSILKRGYAVATLLPAETVIRQAALVPPGANIRVRVAQGHMDCEVTEVAGE